MTVVSRVYTSLQDGNGITGQDISDLIKEARDRQGERTRLYDRYKANKEGVPVLTRTFPISNYSKVNNKLANDFFSDIINTKIGYFAGRPVSYKLTRRDPVSGDVTESLNVDTLLQGFLKRNSIADLDSETAKMAAICGFSARLCYNNLEGEAAVITVPPWECIFINDEIGITDSPYAIRYYTTERGDKKYIKAEFYDDTEISYWIRETDDYDGAFKLDTEEPANPQAHLMNGCPLICFPNNEELMGDAEKVLTLIDSYDRTFSDVNSEIEQFRLAYLLFTGSNPTQEQLDTLRQTGVIGLPDKDDDARFIVKQLNDVIIENHLNRLDENIIYFAQSVRFTDESFGQASGVAMKFKLFNLESKCMTAERKFTRALYRMFTVLQGHFQKRGISYDPWELEFIFVRNFPLNLLDEAQSTVQLKGQVSEITRLSQLSFVEDPEKELAAMQAEEAEYQQANMEIMQAEAELNGMQRQGQEQEQGIGAEASS